MGQKKVFEVGDVVRQRDSNDKGRIVRIVKYAEIRQPNGKNTLPKGVGYIVSLPASENPPVKEALWREDEIAHADCS